MRLSKIIIILCSGDFCKVFYKGHYLLIVIRCRVTLVVSFLDCAILLLVLCGLLLIIMLSLFNFKRFHILQFDIYLLSFVQYFKKQLPVIIHLGVLDRKSTRLNSSHVTISYAVFCLKKKQ